MRQMYDGENTISFIIDEYGISIFNPPFDEDEHENFS